MQGVAHRNACVEPGCHCKRRLPQHAGRPTAGVCRLRHIGLLDITPGPHPGWLLAEEREGGNLASFWALFPLALLPVAVAGTQQQGGIWQRPEGTVWRGSPMAALQREAARGGRAIPGG